jgi:hypothetical protein
MLTRSKSEIFYSIRKCFGKLSQSQVIGIEAIIDEYQDRRLNDLRYLAYILATSWHETAGTMQPIEEYGKGHGHEYGNPVNGIAYYGRGYVQVTWMNNYEKLTHANKMGWDFVKYPELLLQIKPAIWATFYGMETGIFTGKKLNDYFNETKCDPLNARKIINGVDCALKIKGHYDDFLEALK